LKNIAIIIYKVNNERNGAHAIKYKTFRALAADEKREIYVMSGSEDPAKAGKERFA